MIVNDSPAFGELSHHKGEQPARLFPIRHDQLEPPTHERGVRAQHHDLQRGERQTAHFLSIGPVALVVTRADCLEAVDPVRSRLEDDAGRVPVTLQEPVEVFPVPIDNLLVKHCADRCCAVTVGETQSQQRGAEANRQQSKNREPAS